ncbi:MAG: TIM barrel protein [Acidobacteriaceae bacterium]
MSRPVTLFTGQWADLPLEVICEKASKWGYEGIELPCWGDHFNVQKALSDEHYCKGRHELLNKYELKVWAISNHLVGQAVCDLIDERHKLILPDHVWGDGKPEKVRQRAAKEMMDTARAAHKLGVKVAFIKNDPDVLAELMDGEEVDRPGLIVFDLNNANAKPLTLIPKLKAKLKKSTSIVGFLSHLQNELRLKAIEAGCDTVMPRSAFSQNLPNLLRRYGLQDEEEDNFNQ